MNILPLIIGSIFFTVGINIILSYQRFKNLGKKVKGRVKAIEKYQSTSTDMDNHRRKYTFYRPIVEYIYKNETKTMVGGIGSNEIRHKLNQRLNILIIESKDGNIETRIEDGMNYILGIIFSLIGIISIIVYLNIAGGSLLIASIVLPIILTIGITIAKFVENIKGLKTSVYDLNNVKEDSILIETKADYLKEISVHSFWGNLIAYGLMFGSIGIIYAGYNKLPETAQNMLSNDTGEFFNLIISGEIPNAWETALIISGIGIFLFLASIHSALYMRRKYGGMSRI